MTASAEDIIRRVTPQWQIREERPGDKAEVWRVNEAAFGRPDEASLVDQLREQEAILLSRVAEADARIVGHILFSRMWIDSDNGSVAAVALAPLAVAPEHQRRGAGSALIREGLDRLRNSGEGIVIVLGHAHYYPRFGFSCESARALESPFPAEYYMAMELKPGALDGVRGKVRYAPAFGL
jgi:putative acetyltransferase